MIGILCFNSLRYAQFVYKYTEILDKNKVDYELIYWDREGDEAPVRENWIGFDRRINTFQPFYKKIFDFISFTRFMKKQIKRKKYDKLIVLTTQTAIPLYRLLKKCYANKFAYDYRDITYENYSFYRKLVNKLVKASYFTAVSSMGFVKEDNLEPENNKYVMSHNSRDLTPEYVEKDKGDTIRVVYWGQVRQPEFNYKICDLFGKDERFSLVYHGAGYHDLIEKYVKEKGYANIDITGAYKLEEIREFVRSTDLILNAYENDKQQQPAITVKFYDSLKYAVPMIVSRDSYMEKLVNEQGIGITMDFERSTNLDELYNSFKELDMDSYRNNVEKAINDIVNDDIDFENKLMGFVQGT